MTIRLSEKAERRLEQLKAQYPDAKSVVMPALYLVQEEFGCVSDQALLWVAEQTGIAPVHVRELLTSYSLFHEKPLGKYHFQVCGTLSCAVSGARELLSFLAERFKVKPGEVTADGKWSYEQVECLGSCGTGPVCQINDTFFEKLTPAKLEKIIQRIEKEEPDLSFSTVRDELGKGLEGCPKSEVI